MFEEKWHFIASISDENPLYSKTTWLVWWAILILHITKSEAETKHQDKMFLKPFFTKGHPVHIFNHYTNRTQHQQYTNAAPEGSSISLYRYGDTHRLQKKNYCYPTSHVSSRVLFSEMQFLTRNWNVTVTLNISLKIHPLELMGYCLKQVA